jgi:hypothetical protein
MKSDAQVLEAEVMLFSSKTEQENVSQNADSAALTVEKRTIKIDIKNRFARLKRTMRKRSAAIL